MAAIGGSFTLMSTISNMHLRGQSTFAAPADEEQFPRRTSHQTSVVAGGEGEELDNDAMGIEEVPKRTGYDQFAHMTGSGSPATRAGRLVLPGKHADLASRVRYIFRV